MMQPTSISAEHTTIGWIGTGVMGRWMCQHIMDLGYQTNVYNRTPAKADSLISNGASWGDSPRMIAEKSDVIFTIVGFPDDVRQVYFGENGILTGARNGSIVVDMTTTEPSLALDIYEQAKTKGVFAPSST